MIIKMKTFVVNLVKKIIPYGLYHNLKLAILKLDYGGGKTSLRTVRGMQCRMCFIL